MEDVPPVLYARSGEIDIAYTITGAGPIDLVFVPGFVSHRELLWDLPFHAAINRYLGSFSRLISFDKRGTGLSDRSLGFGSVADRMDDIRAVMDAAGIEKAAIFGISEGGPMAILFAATYPDRVTKLVLSGTFARVLRADDYPDGTRPERFEDFFSFIRDHWGTGEVMRLFVQNAPDDVLPLLARYERNCCTPHMVEEIMRCNVGMDVRSALPAIAVPTLVIHSTGDPVIPIRHARYMAERIPGAVFVELKAETHADWQLGAFPPEPRDFLLGEIEAPASDIDRILATVLFTDIVSSTERTASEGDHRWRERLDHHDRIAQREVERFGGRLVKTTGDGVLATFDGPARGIRCADAIRRGVRALDIDVRAGVHTGEVELRGEDIGGLGVVIARRICDTASAAEVLASRTVKELVIGSGISFEDRGLHVLKGIPDDWQLYAVAT